MTQFTFDTPPTATGQNDLLCLLMEGIGKHSVEEDLEELQRFRDRVTAEIERLQSSDTSQARLVVQAVIDLMARHNEAVKTDHRLHAAELKKALRMMVETIGHVSKSSQAAVHQLSVIQTSLEEISSGEDVTKMRSKLGVCLKMIREQAETLHAQSTEQVNYLKNFVASSAVGHHEAAMLQETLDPVTGLPTRAFMEGMIEERLARRADCLVGVVCIQRFNGLLSRFGQAAVGDLLKTFTVNLIQRLPEATTMCRWSNSAFVAITENVSSYAETSQQWRKVNGLKVQRQIDDPTRTGLVVLNTSVMVEHLRPMSSKRALIQDIERFVSQHGGHTE